MIYLVQFHIYTYIYILNYIFLQYRFLYAHRRLKNFDLITSHYRYSFSLRLLVTVLPLFLSLSLSSYSTTEFTVLNIAKVKRARVQERLYSGNLTVIHSITL